MEQYDKESTYCKSLGHYVPFSYCRKVSSQMPCRQILNCWYEKIPIDIFIKEHFNDEEIEKIFHPPQDKVATLIDLIEKAKKNN